MAINKCVRDSSPYVRKAAAHAIVKVCSTDAEQIETLVVFVGFPSWSARGNVSRLKGGKRQGVAC